MTGDCSAALVRRARLIAGAPVCRPGPVFTVTVPSSGAANRVPRRPPLPFDRFLDERRAVHA